MYIAKTIYGYYLSDTDTTIYKHYAKSFTNKNKLYSYAYQIFKLHKNEIMIERLSDNESDISKALSDINTILENHYNFNNDLNILDYNDYEGYEETTINYEVISEIQNVKNYELVISDIRIDTILQCMYIYYTNEAREIIDERE